MSWLSRLFQRELEQPEIKFEGQCLYLRCNGSISTTPCYNINNVTTIPLPGLDPNLTGNQLKISLIEQLQYARDKADLRAGQLQTYLNDNVAERAKMLWLISDIINQQSFSRKDGMPSLPGEVENVKKLTLQGAAYELFSREPAQFTEFYESIKETNITAAEFSRRVLHPEFYADILAANEVGLELGKLGFPALKATGQGKKIFSDKDTYNLAKTIEFAMEERLKYVNDLIREMRNFVIDNNGQFKISLEDTLLVREFLETPKRVHPDLAILFDIALQDYNFNVFFYDEGTVGRISGEYGRSAIIHGLYETNRHRAILPKRNKEAGRETIEQSIGRLEGKFEILNDYVVNFSRVDKEIVWDEESLHRALDRICESLGYPFLLNEPSVPPEETMMMKFSRALLKDIIKPSLFKEVRPYIQSVYLTSGADLLPYITGNNSKFDSRMFFTISTESILDVMHAVNSEDWRKDKEAGWRKAADLAPGLTEYLRNVLLPFAGRRAVELHVVPTRQNITERF